MILALMIMQFTSQNGFAQKQGQIVRLAKLVIDSACLEHYKAYLKEGIETALRVEPGVLTLYALSEKEQPTHFTILETYASAEAFLAHIQSAHFLKYKQGTLHMCQLIKRIRAC